MDGEGSIKMARKETELEGAEWINLAQDREKWRALGEHTNEPSGSIKSEEYTDELRNCLLPKSNLALQCSPVCAKDSYIWSLQPVTELCKR